MTARLQARRLQHPISFAALLVFVATVPIEDLTLGTFGKGATLAGFGACAVWLTTVVASWRLRRPTVVHSLATAFVLWAALSSLWSLDPDATQKKVITLAQLLVAFWMVFDQLWTRARMRYAMQAYALGTLIASILTIFGGTAAQGASRFSVSASAGANSTGCMIVVGVAIAWHLLGNESGRLWAWFYRVCLVLGAIATLFTASRAALVALVGVGAVHLIVESRSSPRRLFGLVALAALGCVLAVMLVPQGSLDRLSTTGSELSGNGTLNNRTTYWRRGWDAFSDHPIAGVGAGAFRDLNQNVNGDGAVAHNVAVSIGAELGLVGLLLFFSSFALAGLGLFVRRPDRLRGWIAIGGAWTVGALSLTWETRKITWVILALVLAAATLPREHDERSVPAPTRRLEPTPL